MDQTSMRANRYAVLVALALCLASCASPEEPAPAPATVPAQPQPEVPMAAPAEPAASASVFADPARICDALASEGFAPLPRTRWNNQDGIGYACTSNSVEVTPGGYQFVGDLPNTITYYVESDVPERVEMFRLTANLFNEDRGAPVVARLQELTRTLFTRLDLAMPEGLPAAIERGQSETFTTDYGTVALTRESYNMGHGLVVTITPAAAQGA